METDYQTFEEKDAFNLAAYIIMDRSAFRENHQFIQEHQTAFDWLVNGYAKILMEKYGGKQFKFTI